MGHHLLGIAGAGSGDVFAQGGVAGDEEFVEGGGFAVCSDGFDGVEVSLALGVFDFGVGVGYVFGLVWWLWGFLGFYGGLLF